MGDTNSDVAGLGVSLLIPEYTQAHAKNAFQVIYAFVVQGGLSVVLSILSVTAEAFQVLARRHPARFGTATSLEKWVMCINSILSNISQAQIINGKQRLILRDSR